MDATLKTVQILQGLMTPVIAVVVAYIAWQQWKANELKLKLERYDRRLRVYQRVVEFLALAMRDFQPPAEAVGEFRRNVAEADFLFPSEISEYCAEIVKHATDSAVARSEYVDMYHEAPPGYDHNKVTAQMELHSRWLAAQFEAAVEKFRPYLDISK